MGSTTRRISNIELQRMKALQGLLEDNGIKLNQIQLGELISEYLLENYAEFSDMVLDKFNKPNKEDMEDPLHRLLFETTDEGIETDSVEEHDVII